MLRPDPAGSPEMSEARTDDDVELLEGVWPTYNRHIITLVLVLVLVVVIGIGTIDHRLLEDWGLVWW